MKQVHYILITGFAWCLALTATPKIPLMVVYYLPESKKVAHLQTNNPLAQHVDTQAEISNAPEIATQDQEVERNEVQQFLAPAMRKARSCKILHCEERSMKELHRIHERKQALIRKAAQRARKTQGAWQEQEAAQESSLYTS